MNIRPIRTQEDYQEALAVASRFFDNEPEPGSEDGDTFEVVLTLLEAYEEKHHPIESPDPIEAIKFRMEQTGARPKDMLGIFGAQNRYHEVMTRKRPLTLRMIRVLNNTMGIPAKVLIQETGAKPATKGNKRVVKVKSGKLSKPLPKKKAETKKEGRRLLNA